MSKDINVPTLRFKEFFGEWEEKKLGNIGSTNNGLTYSPNNVIDSSGHLVLRSSNIQKGIISYLDNVYVDCKINKKEIVKENDILLCSRNGSKHLIGKSILINKEQDGFAFGAFMAVYRSKSNKLVSQFFKSSRFYKQVHQHLGATINQITGKSLNTFKLYLPQKQEEQKIASFLTKSDNLIELLSNTEITLNRYKKSIMQKIFSQKIKFKDDGSDFDDWEVVKLGKYLKHTSIKNKENLINLVLSVNNKKGFISQNEQFNGYEVASKDTSNYKIVNKGEYAYNPSRINVGSIARLKNFNKGIVSPMYIVFKLTDNMNSVFFDNLYQTHRFKHLITVGCSGSVRDSLNFNDMADFKIKIPQIEEQIKIANFLSSIDKQIEQSSKQLEKVKEFKKSLLQQMFI